MNSGHDLGGMQGFGPVVGEPVKPVFHGEWEAVSYTHLTLPTICSV